MRLTAAIIVGLALTAPLRAQSGLEVIGKPSPCYIEHGRGGQLANCDLVVHNGGRKKATLTELQVSVLDGIGKLQIRKSVNGNGTSPSIQLIPKRDVLSGETVLIFNPFYEFPFSLRLVTLRFELTFEDEDKAQFTISTEIHPMQFQNQAVLRVPLRGRLIVWDGHDFYSHHRRWDYEFPEIKEFGMNSNAGRYSYDFVPVNEQGEMYSGPKEKNESWIGFGQPIYATAAGRVVEVRDDQLDNGRMDFSALRQNLLAEFGNYIVIDHGHGEFSLFGHIQKGSAKVRHGEHVQQGQRIASIGASGSSLMPHLHYQLQNSPNGHAEGLPSYFHDFIRVLGVRQVPEETGQIDSGDILIGH